MDKKNPQHQRFQLLVQGLLVVLVVNVKGEERPSGLTIAPRPSLLNYSQLLN